MQTKTLNNIAIVIGIMFAIACFFTPQETLTEYEPIILICFGFPYGLLVVWALLKAGKEKENNNE